MRRAELLERLAGVGGTRDVGEDIRGFGRRLRQLDIDADAGIGEAAGLHVAGIGEHRAGEPQLGLAGDASDLKYDAKLAEAVKKFQRANELPVTGNVDAKTIKELNGPPRDKSIDMVVSNMERWRWYPRDLGNAHVVVNLPDFTLKVMHNGGQVWTTRIVIGKPSMATPLLSETMKYLTVNPTWTVPQSIVRNEYLPALAQDPTVLDRMGLRVSYSGGGVTITQPPGDGNALGRVRFSFNNRFSVFQHDTPDKGYFNDTVRAYSHGCMRVQDPPKYAEVLLNIARPSEHWTAEKIRKMYGGAERDLQLQQASIWVHLTYQTAFIDNAGKLEMRRDIYGLDGRTIAAIKSERGHLEQAPERKREEIATAPRKPTAPAARTSALPQTTYTTPGYARQLPPSIFR